jgi:hypothetical protein
MGVMLFENTLQGDISTYNSIHKLNNIEKSNIDKEWNYHRPRTFLTDFPI